MPTPGQAGGRFPPEPCWGQSASTIRGRSGHSVGGAGAQSCKPVRPPAPKKMAARKLGFNLPFSSTTKLGTLTGMASDHSRAAQAGNGPEEGSGPRGRWDIPGRRVIRPSIPGDCFTRRHAPGPGLQAPAPSAIQAVASRPLIEGKAPGFPACNPLACLPAQALSTADFPTAGEPGKWAVSGRAPLSLGGVQASEGRGRSLMDFETKKTSSATAQTAKPIPNTWPSQRD